MDTKRFAIARWEGDTASGRGIINAPQSGLLKSLRYGPKRNYTGGFSTGESSPEELIAAAHSGCFSMSLAAQLAAAGFSPEVISTRAEVMLESEEDPDISQINLEVKAVVPGVDSVTFFQLAEYSSRNCPVSKLLGAGIICLQAELVEYADAQFPETVE
ncbi:MAG: OsmC family peroxiredoxin [Xanthomonadaceae bacterium]|nr:OsmC family peroxiredoxin [Xanthomonadaceae bacterium]